MDKQPTCLIGVDQFTVVLLAEPGQNEDLDVWPAKVKHIVDEFTQRSEIETFFGHLVPMTTKRPQGSSAALTFDGILPSPGMLPNQNVALPLPSLPKPGQNIKRHLKRSIKCASLL